MISQEKYQAVQKLLADGVLSQRRIAALVGVNRGTVRAIAAETRSHKNRRTDKTQDRWTSDDLSRCPICGNMVMMPCLICEIQQRGFCSDSSDEAITIGFDLKPDHQERLQEIIDRQIASGIRMPTDRDTDRDTDK